MELIRLDVSINEADTRFKVLLNATSQCPKNNEGDDKAHKTADENSSLMNIKNNIYTLGRGPLLQITDSKISRLDNSRQSNPVIKPR